MVCRDMISQIKVKAEMLSPSGSLFLFLLLDFLFSTSNILVQLLWLLERHIYTEHKMNVAYILVVFTKYKSSKHAQILIIPIQKIFQKTYITGQIVGTQSLFGLCVLMGGAYCISPPATLLPSLQL